MTVDPQLLAQALRTPESQDVTQTPIVRAVILADPANAADLVPSLGRPDTLEARNARRVLCAFGADAVGPLLTALAGDAGPRARREGIAVLWTLLTLEEVRTTREALGGSDAELAVLLRDTSPLPDELPATVERDFTGRVCDLAYVVVRELLDPDFDQSGFRAQDDDERDRAIAQWRSRRTGSTIA
jgi:hypothetical protein